MGTGGNAGMGKWVDTGWVPSPLIWCTI